MRIADGAGPLAAAVRALTTPRSLAISSPSGLRGSFNTTENSDNTRWELRGLNKAGTRNEEFDLVDDAPILDTEVCVLGLERNHAVLSQIHGQSPTGGPTTT